MNIKSIGRFAAASAVVLVATAAARAQSLMSVTIPFSYSVPGRNLPAGEYKVNAETTRGFLIIRSVDGKHAAMVLAQQISHRREAQVAPTLKFNRYGEKYFLSEVWNGQSENALQLRKSPAEREEIAALAQSVVLKAQR